MFSNPVDTAIHAGLSAAIPRPLSTSQWAQERRVISEERVADKANAGPWRNERVPYLTKIMDAVDDPETQEVGMIKSAQTAGSEFGLNVIGKRSDIDPCPILYVAETELKARAFANEMVDPMVRDTFVKSKHASMRNVWSSPISRDKDNTSIAKKFRGGGLYIGWATSAAMLSSRPITVVILDECDAYESTREGDPIKLAEARTKTAGTERKIIYISTPRDKDKSRMVVLWDNSTQEKYFVPCPHCDEYQILKWANVKWENDPQDAYYVCDLNGCCIEHDDKFDMLARGEWRSTNPDYVGRRRRFFWINEIYSPFTTWGDMATAFVEAKEDFAKTKDSSSLKVFVNTRLAEWWEDQGEQVDYEDLTWHKHEYEAEVPEDVLFLTAAVDVQGNRLEVSIIGWGADNENWLIGYKILYGVPGTPKHEQTADESYITLPAVWDELRDVLDDEYETPYGTMKIASVCIDTGYLSEYVYKFCKKHAGRKWNPVKGASNIDAPLINRPTRKHREGRLLFIVGNHAAKDLIFSWLKVSDHGPSYCHFPDEPFYNDAFFQQLCSEKKIKKYHAGTVREVYVPISKLDNEKEIGSRRNEVLDTFVYNIAAREILNPSYPALIARNAQMRENAQKNQHNPAKNDNIPLNRPKRRQIIVKRDW